MQRLTLICAVLQIFFGSCTEGYKLVLDDNGVNSWVHSTMKNNYLWASEIPGFEATNSDVSPTAYFDTYMRYRDNKNVGYAKDTYGDRYSRITATPTRAASNAYEPLLVSNEPVNDFGFGIRTFEYNRSGVTYVTAVQIIYVVPGSPADLAGVRRGDKFNAINGISMPAEKSRIVDILSRSAIKISINYPENKSVTLDRETYFDTPTLFDSIYDTSPKTGYLVYNHFSAGQSNRFINELNAVFIKFKQAGVRDLILDMRYNGGGELSVARHLASLIARTDMLGKPLVYKESCGSYGQPELFSMEDFMGPDANAVVAGNIDAQRVYIITSSRTASASELIMHALKPYYNGNMGIIGQKTTGKNVGTVEITNQSYQWKIYPVTMRIYNKDKVSGYEAGINSDIYVTEVSSGEGRVNISDFGDTQNEILLNRTMVALHPQSYRTTQFKSVKVAAPNNGELIIETHTPQTGLIVDRITE